MTERVIDIRGLTKYYGPTRGIEDLDLSINRGEIFGFLGPNGAGKTTTLRLLLGLLKPTRGTVCLFGRDLSRMRHSLFRRIGTVPGEFTLYRNITGRYFLNFMNSLSGNEAVLQEELIADFRLSDRDLDRKIRFYSNGMKQKLVIIQALQEDPDLLVMDEPGEGLDPLNQNVLYEYLKRFRDHGKTIFLSSHNLAEVEKICNTVGLVRRGKLVAVESLASLKKKMVRRMEITFAGETVPDNLHPAPVIEKKGNRAVLKVSGDINPLLGSLANYSIEDLVFPEATLEDIFLSYYRGENDEA